MMEITGTKIERSKVTITVRPEEVLSDLDSMIRRKLNIKDGFIKFNKATGKPELWGTEHSYHNGDPYDVLLDNNPDEEAITYYQAYDTFRGFLSQAELKR